MKIDFIQVLWHCKRILSTMLNNRKNIVLAAAIVVLAGVAIAGWVRNTPGAAPTNANGLMAIGSENSAQTPGSYAALPKASGAYPGNQYSGSGQQDGYYSSNHRPVYVRQNVPARVVSESQQPQESVYEDRRSERVYRAERHHGRSTGKSVAIVAGSAGAGAAIGAIAGGGKGAAIGAASGGGAGFIYDRLTHNH